MSFDNIKMVSQPKNLKINLFQHQLASIYKMENLESNNFIEKENYNKETKIGVNADIAGFGKTLSMIGLILRDKMEWDLETPFIFEKIVPTCKNRIKTYYIKRFEKLPTTLILVSQSLIGQWDKELQNTNLKYQKILTQKNIENLNPRENDIVLVIPTMYNKLVSVYSDYAWKRFIFDEPGHIKVPSMKEIYANFYWLITATPNSIITLVENLKNNFMKDLIQCVNDWEDIETRFEDIILRNDPEFIKASFEMPQTNHIYHECYNSIYNAIQNFVSPTIKSMIEGGNIEDAITALGGEKTSNIIELIKLKKIKEKEEIELKITLYKSRDDTNNLTLWENKRKNVLNQLNDIDKKFELMLSEPCSICYDNLKDPILDPNCQNLFCGECLLKWIEKNNSCPLCRKNIDLKKIIYIKTSNNSNNSNNLKNIKQKRFTKNEKIIEIIKNKKDGKFLIFSEYEKSFVPIFNILKENEIPFLEIKGSSQTREKNLQTFKNGDINVIFLNSTINGAGLNLQESTDIILYHEMKYNDKNQIIGRANRIGRKMPLTVHYLNITE
jgi:hypothetical protein